MTRSQLRIGVLLVLLIAIGGWAMQSKQAFSLHRFVLAQNSPADPAGQNGSTTQADKLMPGPDDDKISLVTAQILSHSNYLHRPLDAEMSSRVLNEYLDTIDPRHMFLLQSDVDDFDVWRPKLGAMLMKGDTVPANKIFVKLLERIDQQVAYSNQLLKTEKFTFDGNDVFEVDRKHAPRPKDITEAHALWREYVRYEYLQEKLNHQQPDQIVKTLTRRFTGMARTWHEYDDSDILNFYLNALAHAYDPHSDYLGKTSLTSFNIQMKLSVAGIGALLGQDEDGYAQIEQLIPGGPAIKSHQLKVHDRIVAVGQGTKEPVDTTEMKLDDVVNLVRGAKGTQVRLVIFPKGAPDPSVRKTVTLIRDNVRLEEQEAKAELVDYPINTGKDLRLGIINLPSFYADMDTRSGNRKSTTADVARLLKKLQTEKVDGVILDLRTNPGGSLEEVIDMMSLFARQGPVVQVKSPDGSTQSDSDKNSSVLYTGPMIVLTNRLSASASEILAAALQDYGRALIVGDDSTFGKGTVQTIASLGSIMQRNNIPVSSDPGALKLTIQKFYRVNGSSTQLRGVVPDIVLPSLTNYLDIGEKSLDYPLPWDTIPGVSYPKLNLIQPILPELKKRSEARITQDKDFSFLQEQIAQFKKMMAQKTVSLNEQQRLQEKQDAEARAKQERAELLALPESKEKVYVLTLEQLDKPGLPPPISWKSFYKNNAQSTASSEDTTGTEQGETPPAIDTTLKESEHILADMIALSSRPVARSPK